MNARAGGHLEDLLEGFSDRLKDPIKKRTAKNRLKTLLGENVFQVKAKTGADLRDVVAYDVGPKHIAVSTTTHSFQRLIAKGIVNKEAEKKRISRKLDRSKRKSNPDLFNENDTVKKGKHKWTFSKNYGRLRSLLADKARKQAAQVNTSQGELINEILQLGSVVKTENVSLLSFQKNYGKSVGIFSPGSFKNKLTRKAENARGRFEKINTYQTCLSQTCLCGSKAKKPLSQRQHVCKNCGLGQYSKIGRDEFSAYLAAFTVNTVLGTKRKSKYASRLDLESANRHAKGHLNLSLVAPNVTDNETQSEGNISSSRARGGAQSPTLESSTKREQKDVLEPAELRSSRRKRTLPEFSESPASKVKRP